LGEIMSGKGPNPFGTPERARNVSMDSLALMAFYVRNDGASFQLLLNKYKANPDDSWALLLAFINNGVDAIQRAAKAEGITAEALLAAAIEYMVNVDAEQ
jgi:hypothetical protein